MNVLAAVSSLLIDSASGPLTNETGGTSLGDPNAGADSDTFKTNLPPITTSDRAGASILTLLGPGRRGRHFWVDEHRRLATRTPAHTTEYCLQLLLLLLLLLTTTATILLQGSYDGQLGHLVPLFVLCLSSFSCPKGLLLASRTGQGRERWITPRLELGNTLGGSSCLVCCTASSSEHLQYGILVLIVGLDLALTIVDRAGRGDGLRSPTALRLVLVHGEIQPEAACRRLVANVQRNTWFSPLTTALPPGRITLYLGEVMLSTYLSSS